MQGGQAAALNRPQDSRHAELTSRAAYVVTSALNYFILVDCRLAGHDLVPSPSLNSDRRPSYLVLEMEMIGQVTFTRKAGGAPMSGDDAGTSARTTAAVDKGTTKPHEAPAEGRTAGGRIARAGREKSAQLAGQAKSTARLVTDKTRTAATRGTKRTWGAGTAAVTAVAGLTAGWVIRRRRQARPGWRDRLRRLRR
jgi:hypothetical protein